jgi:xylulokinase
VEDEMDTILGIDIGTNYIKAAAYDLTGQMLCIARRKAFIHHSSYGFSEYDAEEVWSGVCSCLEELTANPACGFICSIAVSSIGESNLFVNKSGEPCHPVIAWFDQRAVGQMHEIEQRIDKKALYHISGQILSPKFGLCKLLWIKDNMPEAFRSAYKCLSMQDFILYKLTDVFATDYSLASRMMCFDIKKLSWSQDILTLAGIPAWLMPDAHPGGTKIGTVSRHTASLTGLTEGIPVFTGGHDQSCAAVAVNIFEEGVMLDSVGAAETTIIATDEILPLDKGFENALCIYPHFGSKMYRVITSIQASGASTEWFLTSFGAPAAGTVPEEITQYEQLLVEAEQSGGRLNNLFFLPYIRGLQENPLARGAFIGIDDSSGRSCFIRAILEGICFELRRRSVSCENAFRIGYDTLRTVGSLSNSPRLMNLKATITGKRIEIPECSEAACYGAALLGAIGLGIFTESDLTSLYRKKTTYLPILSEIQTFDRKYKTYLQIQEDLSALYARLGRIY